MKNLFLILLIFTSIPTHARVANNVYRMPNSGNIPAWGPIDLTKVGSITNSLGIANGGTGAATQQLAINALAGAVTSGNFLRGNGTNILLGAIQAADVPTLNQNTSGSAASLSAVNPVTLGGTGLATLTANNVILGNGTSNPTFVAPGSSGNILQSNGTTWASAALTSTYHAPTVQIFTSTGTRSGSLFTVTSANATVGATYTNNGQTFTVLATIASGTQLYTSGVGAPTASGTLTKASGTGDATITFSLGTQLATYTPPVSPAPLYCKIKIVAAGAGGQASGTTAGTPAATAGTGSYFGVNGLITNGGAVGSANSSGGTGGSASIGTGFSGLALVGGGGGAGDGIITSSGGVGGSSFYGGAGKAGGGQGASGQAGGTAGANTGSGGGGAGAGTGAGNGSGAGGGAGGSFDGAIWSIPAVTFYAVGVHGTGQGAGTSGSAGGDAADGSIEVTEYYQ